jgi:hypothetical protein
VNEPFETPPELKGIEAMLEEAHPLTVGFDVEETRIAQDRIVFESGKVIGRQTSESNWWKAATAIMSGVAVVLLFMQSGPLVTEQPSIELVENASNNRKVLADTPRREATLLKQAFDQNSRIAYQDTDFEDDEAYFSFLNQRS